MAELTLAERLQYEGVRSLLGGLTSYAPGLLRRRPRTLDGLTLHPEMQLILALRELRGGKSWHELPIKRARLQTDSEARLSAGPRLWVGPVRDFEIPGHLGALRVRHYAPLESGARPLLVFFHGGGFVLGSLDSHDQPCRFLCKHAGIHVLSVDYRLAPEHPFPAALEDAFAALRWAQAHAALLGADPARVAVAGDSAGANIATAVGLMAKTAGERLPEAQLLLYPTVDRVSSWRSLELFGKGFFLTRRDIEWCTEHYAAGADLHNPLITPLLSPDLKGSSPALVVTAGFDPLRDEGEAYESALRAAGCRAELVRYPDMIHGFINMTGLSPAAERALVDTAVRFRNLLSAL